MLKGNAKQWYKEQAFEELYQLFHLRNYTNAQEPLVESFTQVTLIPGHFQLAMMVDRGNFQGSRQETPEHTERSQGSEGYGQSQPQRLS